MASQIICVFSERITYKGTRLLMRLLTVKRGRKLEDLFRYFATQYLFSFFKYEKSVKNNEIKFILIKKSIFFKLNSSIFRFKIKSFPVILFKIL
jgi:hypothetical protein